jgi:hypothetical protein
MKNFKFIFPLCGIIILLGNNCSRKNETITDLPLLNSVWKLSSVQSTISNNVLNYPDTGKLFEYINFTDSALLINEACGNYGQADYFVKNDTIKFTKFIIWHWMLCDLDQWESYVENNLDSAYKFINNGSQLKIFSKGSYNLLFKPYKAK